MIKLVLFYIIAFVHRKTKTISQSAITQYNRLKLTNTYIFFLFFKVVRLKGSTVTIITMFLLVYNHLRVDVYFIPEWNFYIYRCVVICSPHVPVFIVMSTSTTMWMCCFFQGICWQLQKHRTQKEKESITVHWRTVRPRLCRSQCRQNTEQLYVYAFIACRLCERDPNRS